MLESPSGEGGSGRGGSAPREGEGLLPGGSALGGSAPGRGVSRPGGVTSQHALWQTPPVDRHTLVKILPWPNFVVAGKYYLQLRLRAIKTSSTFVSSYVDVTNLS